MLVGRVQVIRFSLSVALRQLAGIGLLATLIWVRLDGRMEDPTSWWAGFMVGVALVAPEVLDALARTWKAWKA
jgi:hypothetical protein